MTAYIASTATDTNPLIQFNKRVTSISRSGDAAMINDSVRDESSPRTSQYLHVISIIPLPCLQMIELGDAGLNVMQKNALRKLQYGPLIECLGTLINTSKVEYEEELKELVLHNLMEVYNVDYGFLLDQYVDMHAWDWGYNPFLVGAFEFVGYQTMTCGFQYRLCKCYRYRQTCA
ncbi:hypothetical protein BD769DRAFT_1747160 [Suillus cothurnatus]|nr:hypothetical protein BD769DRAFT_1747160 [Suillus cothurnatus]